VKITVLMGGTSAERDVSMASGLRIAAALRGRGHDVTSLDTALGVMDAGAERAMLAAGVQQAPPTLEALAAMSRQSLSPSLGTLPAVRDADLVFLALHGGQGEDGTIQALFDLCGVRYTGTGPLGSALAMDKDLSKRLFRDAGVTTPDWLMAPASVAEVEAQLGFPVIVKPSKQGSTVGLTLVRGAADLAPAIAEAFRYDDEVMIEAFIAGRELTVGILGDEALPIGEIIPKHELYDYECKYTAGMAVEEFPARLAGPVAAMVQDQAVRAFRALKLRGYARIDFRLSASGGCFCLEANTLPGMTELSLIPQAAAAAGITFPDLCERIVRLATPDGRS
jgi:D-alanine-D-alanine ligase